MSAFTEDEVLIIINTYKMQDRSYHELARIFGVNAMTLNLMVRRKTWGHVA